jgi:hypothetical protein
MNPGSPLPHEQWIVRIQTLAASSLANADLASILDKQLTVKNNPLPAPTNRHTIA